MNIKMSMRTEKFLISFKVMIIFWSSSLKEVHDLASLNTLRSLMALRAEIAPPLPILTPIKPMIYSTIEIMTTEPSKMLKLSAT
jgi:hypothetical protein